MTKIIRKETRKRGLFGWLALVVFLLFNVIMLIAFVGGMQGAANLSATTDAERAGHAIGTMMGATALLTIWVLGDIILGAFVLLTRGRKITIEERIEP